MNAHEFVIKELFCDWSNHKIPEDGLKNYGYFLLQPLTDYWVAVLYELKFCYHFLPEDKKEEAKIFAKLEIALNNVFQGRLQLTRANTGYAKNLADYSEMVSGE